MFFACESGVVKKTPLAAFSRPRRAGIRAIAIEENDALIGAELCQEESEVMLATRRGSSIRFSASDVRSMGRVARGVRGIRLAGDDRAVSLLPIEAGVSVFTACGRGFGKITSEAEYRKQGRGGKGIRNIVCSDRNGAVVAALAVRPGDEVMLLSEDGVVIRSSVAAMRLIGRSTQGVRLMDLRGADRIVDVATLGAEDLEDDSGAEGPDDPGAEGPDDPGAGDDMLSTESATQ